MSDDEEVYSEEESEEPARPSERRAPSKPIDASGLDEESQALLEANAAERDIMADEIAELRARSIQRKKEREEEEREAARKREEEEERRREEEEERKAKKMEEEEARRAKRNEQMAEFAKAANQKGPNFVISKKAVAASGGGDEEEGGEGEGKMSREQLELEKQQILKQRIVPLDIDGFDDTKLKAKAESLHKQLLMLEGERYDLEKRFRAQQQDMLEMAEKARAQNQSGRGGGVKRVAVTEENPDRIQEKYSGAPARIEMYSKFERQQDKRVYAEKKTVFKGPSYAFPAERIAAGRSIVWNEEGLPSYVPLGSAPPAPAAEEAAEEAPAEEEVAAEE